MAEKKLHLSVITPARSVFEGEAASVVVPAFDGELGVLPGHAALLALLGNGALRVTGRDGNSRHWALRGGFLQVKENAVTVLTPEALAAGELDAAAIKSEIEQLQAEKAVTDEAIQAKEQKLGWARARRKLLEAARGEHRN